MVERPAEIQGQTWGAPQELVRSRSAPGVCVLCVCGVCVYVCVCVCVCVCVVCVYVCVCVDPPPHMTLGPELEEEDVKNT
jgi:hypothetical protein